MIFRPLRAAFGECGAQRGLTSTSAALVIVDVPFEQHIGLITARFDHAQLPIEVRVAIRLRPVPRIGSLTADNRNGCGGWNESDQDLGLGTILSECRQIDPASLAQPRPHRLERGGAER